MGMSGGRAMIEMVLVALAVIVAEGGSNCNCKAWLVQSIPTGTGRIPDGVVSTADVFQWLAGNSSGRLDIIAQYWQLLAQADNPLSGDYGYSEAEMESFGAGFGSQVYNSIKHAADRNVKVRLLQHSGVYPDYTEEASMLAFNNNNVENVTLLLSDWWGSGIIHSKLWISDRKHFYIGSANNDWKSLTQVKELGIYVVGCPKIAEKVEEYYNNLWKLASLNSSEYTKTVWDQQSQIYRKVPCWSHFVSFRERCSSPLPSYVNFTNIAGYPNLENPYMFRLPIETPGYSNSSENNSSSYLSFAPPELSFDTFQTDEQAWVDTIKSVGLGGTVRINTMDWLGQSQYTKQTVFWPSLSSAISEVVFSKHAKVKILVAYWAHLISGTDEYLKWLLYSNALCTCSEYNHCGGKVEIKYYRVPGFNDTGAAVVLNGTETTETGNIYPGYTRVNHGKYAVSDVRAHIGTSNLIWDYFYTTSGVSFGTYNPSIVTQLQHIFDADWDSPYAAPVEPLQLYSTSLFAHTLQG